MDDVRAAKAGDRDAFARLVARHERIVTAVALARVSDPQVAREVAQDTFLAAWRDLPRLRDDAQFAAWLRRIADHHAVSVARRVRPTPVPDEALARVADDAPDAHASLASREDSLRVAAALESLPEETRAAAVLHWRDGATIAEIADALGVRDDAVRKRLSRARERMKGELLASLAIPSVLPSVMPRLGVRAIARLPLIAASLGAAALLGGLTFMGLHDGAPNPEAEEKRFSTDASARRDARRLDLTATGRSDGPAERRELPSGLPAEKLAVLSADASPRATPTPRRIGTSERTEPFFVFVMASREPKIAKAMVEGAEVVADCGGSEPVRGSTNAKGFVELQLPDVACQIHASHRAKGYGSWDRKPNEGKTFIRLVPGADLRGVLVDRKGHEVDANGTITLRGGRVPSTGTIVRGRFELVNVEGGERVLWTMLKEAPDADPLAVTLAPGETREVTLVVPDRGTRVIGRVVDSIGRPVADALLFLENAGATRDAGKTDSSGRFQLDDLRFDLVLRVEGEGLLTYVELPALGEEPTRIVGDVILR